MMRLSYSEFSIVQNTRAHRAVGIMSIKRQIMAIAWPCSCRKPETSIFSLCSHNFDVPA